MKTLPHIAKKPTLLFSIFFLFILVFSCEQEDEHVDIEQLTGIWELDKIINKKTRDTLKAPDVKISFQKNGCVTLFTSFNYGQGEYTISGSKVHLPIKNLSDRKYDELMDVIIINNLSGWYSINGISLKIFSDSQFDLEFYRSNLVDSYQCDLTKLLIDSIETNRYYSDTIINPDFSAIYGKWFLQRMHHGWSGTSLAPAYDFLEIKKNGIYGVVKDFELIEYGRITTGRTYKNSLEIQLIPNSSSIPSRMVFGWVGFRDENIMFFSGLAYDSGSERFIRVK